MAEKCYTIREIPDLTLGKYDFLSENGVDGVLELHNSFLRQWHEKSILSGVSLHLLYAYRKAAPQGRKIGLFFIVKGSDKSLSNIDQLLSGGPLSAYFRFEPVYSKNDQNEVTEEESYHDSADFLNMQFQCCNTLTKEEVLSEGSDGNHYYTVPVWEANSEGRLFDMLRLTETLDMDCIYRIDICARKKNRDLRNYLYRNQSVVSALHELQSNRGINRDYAADSLLRSYDELLKGLDSTVHFSANVFVFSNTPEDGSMILASAVSEAIKKGDYNIKSFRDAFDAHSFLDERTYNMTSNQPENPFRLVYDGKSVKITSDDFTEKKISNALSCLPTLYTLPEIAPLFRFPCLFDGESICLRKETNAPFVDGDNVICLGKDSDGTDVNIPLSLFTKHAFISGVPGSGKTNTMHHIINSLWEKHSIPFLVFEPAKKEYRALCNLESMRAVRLFSPGSNTRFPLHINPFQFAKGLTVSEHIRSLRAVFEGAFPMINPTPFILDSALEAVYRKCGWTPKTVYTDHTALRFPTMSMLYEQLEKELDSTQYRGETRDNIEAIIKVRIGSLLRREMGDVFDVEKSTLSPEEWLNTPAVIELEAMGSGPANFLTLMLCSLIRECLKVDPKGEKSIVDVKSKGLRHVIFIEEAHNLIGPESEEKTGDDANPKIAATAYIKNMLAEVRAYYEGLVIADQLPTAMAPEVIKNTGLKISLRLTAMDDRQLLGSSMSANNSQIEEMAIFRTGDALISYEKLQRPFRMRMKQWCGEYDEAQREELTAAKNDSDLFRHIRNTDSYRDTVERSLNQRGMRIITEFDALAQKANSIVELAEDYCQLGEEYCILLDQYEYTVSEAQKILEKYADNPGDAENDPEYQAYIELGAKQAAELEETQKVLDTAADNPRIDGAASIINELMQLAKTITDEILYYKSLGLMLTPEDVAAYQSHAPINSFSKAKIQLITLRYVVLEKIYDAMCLVYKKTAAIRPFHETVPSDIAKFAEKFGFDSKKILEAEEI